MGSKLQLCSAVNDAAKNEPMMSATTELTSARLGSATNRSRQRPTDHVSKSARPALAVRIQVGSGSGLLSGWT